MKTIKWLVESLPKGMRTLFAVLLIAVSTLATVIVNIDRRYESARTVCEQQIKDVQTSYQIKVDSLNAVILKVTQENNKKEIEVLRSMIKQQKDIINSQSKQSKK